MRTIHQSSVVEPDGCLESVPERAGCGGLIAGENHTGTAGVFTIPAHIPPPPQYCSNSCAEMPSHHHLNPCRPSSPAEQASASAHTHLHYPGQPACGSPGLPRQGFHPPSTAPPPPQVGAYGAASPAEGPARVRSPPMFTDISDGPPCYVQPLRGVAVTVQERGTPSPCAGPVGGAQQWHPRGGAAFERQGDSCPL